MECIKIKNNNFYLSDFKDEHIVKLSLFNKDILNGLEKKSYFIIPKRKDFLSHLKNKSKVFILFNNNKKIIAYFIISFFQEDFEDWNKDFNILKKDVKYSAKIDSVAVDNNYRNKGIFKFFMAFAFKYLKKNNFKYILSHVHPLNKVSLECFLSLGFIVVKKDHFLKSVRLFLKKEI
jgi:ribosomal protein S18 acetylase RimI-like enzyme